LTVQGSFAKRKCKKLIQVDYGNDYYYLTDVMIANVFDWMYIYPPGWYNWRHYVRT